MKTTKLVSFVALGLVLNACTAPGARLHVPQDLQVSAQVGQVRQGFFEVSNAGGSPLTYEVAVTTDASTSANWLNLTGDKAGRLAAGEVARVTFAAHCPETAGDLETTLNITSDAPDRPSATTQVTLTCKDALAPGEEGLVAALGTWNWGADDAGALGSSLLVGFRYLQPTTVTVTLTGPSGWNGGAPRRLVLPGPTFEDDAPSEDVWTYDLLTDETRPPQGSYHLTATTDRGDSYAADLNLDSSHSVKSPKNVTVTPEAGGVAVTWTPVPGAKAYYAVVTDPSDELVPRAAANSAAGLGGQAVRVYAQDFTKATSLQLETSLAPGKRYQVTVVAFNSDLVLGDSETKTLALDLGSFDTSSTIQAFTYAP